jgi:hypothetical protein
MIGMPTAPQRLPAGGTVPARGEEQGDPSGRTKAARAHRSAVSHPEVIDAVLGSGLLRGRRRKELGGYGHVVVTVDCIEDALARLAEIGVERKKPPYRPDDDRRGRHVRW